ncbi:hypothetical protein F2P56_007422 [Juglans regia]|uniref:Reverse transcriptase domain-containing protein n=1 Tax=Juglans regia TaxID=51240 RepID=A0A833XSA5_JUGRE|nr:hypothetical protein F2P56_007422 [Juglans regia]KAF5475631.1 hypothetical protein F2P56_007422 [Juglans regia]
MSRGVVEEFLFEELPPLTTPIKPSSDVIPDLDLKPLPAGLKYVFMGLDNTFPMVISSTLTLTKEEKLIGVLKRHKGAIGWTTADIKGISPLVCTHKIYLEENEKPSREMQRRLNPTMKEVVKNEVLKLLDVGIIYSISDSRWVSPTQVVPKKSGITVVKNDKDELIPTRVATGWQMHIDYRKLNATTRNDHFPLPFLDQIIEKVAGHAYYCFLDGFSWYYQIEIAPKDHEKTTFTCPFGTFAFRRMAFGLSFKTSLGMSPYRLVYEKSCHLPIEIEHKAYLAIKQLNFNSDQAGKLRSRWSGLYVVKIVFPHGAIEIVYPQNGNTFKVNGQRVKPFIAHFSPEESTLPLQDPPIWIYQELELERNHHKETHVQELKPMNMETLFHVRVEAHGKSGACLTPKCCSWERNAREAGDHETVMMERLRSMARRKRREDSEYKRKRNFWVKDS